MVSARKASITVRNVPADSIFFNFFDVPDGLRDRNFRNVLFDKVTGRVVGYITACPIIAVFTLCQFYHAYTSDHMVYSKPPSLLFSDRFQFMFDDPLQRGKVFSFDEHDSDGVSRERCYMYDTDGAQFVKFCGFDSSGEYIGLLKAGNVTASAAKLESRAAANTYQMQAIAHKKEYADEWAFIVKDVPKPVVGTPVADSCNAVRNLGEHFFSLQSPPPSPQSMETRKAQWFLTFDKFKSQDGQQLPRPQQGAITKHVWGAFCDACWAGSIRETFTVATVTKSLETELGRKLTAGEILGKVADCMAWCIRVHYSDKN